MLGTILEITFNRELVDQSGTGNNTEGVSFNVFEPDDTQLIWYTVKTNPNLSNTITPLEFQEVTQNGVLGAASAQSYLDRFIASQPNYQDNYTITRTDNVVTITIINGEWNFNRTFVSSWVTIMSSGPVNTVDPDPEPSNALIVENKIDGQLVSSSARYFYLYEPLPVLFTAENLAAKQLLLSVSVRDVNTFTPIEYFEDYAVYDINPGQPINIDLMKIIQQLHNADVWKIGAGNEITNNPDCILSPYSYIIEYKTDIETPGARQGLSIIPILGGRMFCDFDPLISNNFPLDDFVKLGVTRRIYEDYPNIIATLNEPDTALPKLNLINNQVRTGLCADAGVLYWKSRLGGWMQWGFDIKTFTKKSKYQRPIKVGMFDTLRNEVGQNPFVPTDYAEVDYSHSLTLKSLSLTQEELEAVSSISESPVCYYLKEPGGRLELMRISSATTPQNSLANGGDFNVSLKNISITDFKTR